MHVQRSDDAETPPWPSWLVYRSFDNCTESIIVRCSVLYGVQFCTEADQVVYMYRIDNYWHILKVLCGHLAARFYIVMSSERILRLSRNFLKLTTFSSMPHHQVLDKSGISNKKPTSTRSHGQRTAEQCNAGLYFQNSRLIFSI